MNVQDLATHELFVLFAGVLDELRRRDIIRSTNNPVADYAEHLVTRSLSLTLAPKSTTGYDATDSTDRRYQIKARRLTRHNDSTQLSAIRSLDAQHFSHLAGVLFNEDFSVHRACVIPYDLVRQLATYRAHVNAHILHLQGNVWSKPGVVDITQPMLETQRLDLSFPDSLR